MRRFNLLDTFSLSILLLVLAACGGGRQLRSVAIAPTTADAKNFPNGQVQFTATGTFSGSPSPASVTSPEIFWCVGGSVSAANPTAGVCAGNIAQFASVDQTGLAQCSSSPPQQTTVYVLAGTPEKLVNPDIGPTLKIYGSAQLTCP